MSGSVRVVIMFATMPLATPLYADANGGIVGTWRGPENSVIRILPCGGSLCAQVLSTGDETAARVDTNNPDAALRRRPLCGLQIGEGFHGNDPNKAEGGHLYDPRSGKTYKGSMVSQGDVLLLRGYIGVSMFGRTARWSRVQEPVEVCRNTPASAGAHPALPATASPTPTPAPNTSAPVQAVAPASTPAPAPSQTPTPTAAPTARPLPAPSRTPTYAPDASKAPPQP